MPANVEIDERFVRAGDGAALRCLSAGSGPNTLVLIPGWTMTADIFEHQLSGLARCGLRVVSFDPRGQGASTKDWTNHDYETRGDDVACVIDAFASGPVVLGSWSQGTFEHLSFVRRHGRERTAATVIIDGAPREVAQDVTREWAWCECSPTAAPELHITNWIVNPTANRAEFNQQFIEWMLDDPTPAAVDWLRQMSNKTPDGIASLISAMAIAVDYQAELRELAASQPTLIFAREEWLATVRAWVDVNAPRARLESIRKHAGFWEHPVAFNALLGEFLTTTMGLSARSS